MTRNRFDIDEALKSKFNFKDLLRISHYIKPYIKKILSVIFLMIIMNASSLLGPFLIKEAIDVAIPTKNVHMLLILSLIFMGTLLIIMACSKLRITTINNIGQCIIRDIRLDLFTHMQELPFSYYDSRPHGKILVRVTSYVNSIGELLSNGIVTLIIDLINLIFIVAFMFAIDTRLTLICLAGLPFLIGAIFLIKDTQRKLGQQVSAKQSNMNAYIHERIAGVKITQSFTQEENNLKILERLGQKFKDSWMAAVRINYILGPVIEIISMTVTCAIYMAGIIWIQGGVSLGVLIAFISYTGRFWGPINSLSNFYNSIITAMAYLERIFETMDEKPIVTDSENAYELPQVSGRVEFRDVVFRYEEEGRIILDNASFAVEPGETAALVGPTGAGKTTIVNL
ncbi:MAG: ABC transporter ATP-binding protein, partial [Clostridiales bacterium]|nr:ABC transporter ATP-binding protein [Clostridiales bacterium]